MEKQLSLIFKFVLSILSLLIVSLLTLILVIFTGLTFHDIIPKSNMQVAMETDFFQRNYNVTSLGNSKEDKMIKYGHQLITKTPIYLSDYTGNQLACQNCHLEAGTKPFAAPYIGVTQRFPKFQKREGKTRTIEDRINGCMERSMNGKKLENDSKNMQAMVAYMKWLGHDIPIEYSQKHLTGKGLVKIDIPNRKVDLIKGKSIYETQCASCHQLNGSGKFKQNHQEYLYPPVWGNDSYNDGAGMHRVLTAAKFIKANMPFGANAKNPILTDEEAYDVAGYINSFQRPQKANTQQDFPDPKYKPVSTPYPPFDDSFSKEQHKYGPFPEIIEFYQQKYNIKKDK